MCVILHFLVLVYFQKGETSNDLPDNLAHFYKNQYRTFSFSSTALYAYITATLTEDAGVKRKTQVARFGVGLRPASQRKTTIIGNSPNKAIIGFCYLCRLQNVG